MTDQAPVSKEELTLPERLRKAYVAIGQVYGYVGSIDEAADAIEELERDIVRWKNAHQVVMIERDSFKAQAELNRQTIISMQASKPCSCDDYMGTHLRCPAHGTQS